MKKSKTRVAVVVYSSYPFDVRVRREAETLQKNGMSVDVICYRKNGQPTVDQINNIRIFRLNISKKRSGKIRYLWEYSVFTVKAFILLTKLHLQKRYHIIHIHNMPDTLVFASILPKISGSKILLDLHDPMPEVFMSKFKIADSHFIIRLLKFFEKLSIRFADKILTPNKTFKDLFAVRSCPPEKISIVMNTPDETTFWARKIDESCRKHLQEFRIMYHGTIVERHGLDVALYAVKLLQTYISNIRFDVFGDGDFTETFLKKIQDLDLSTVVNYHGLVLNEKIAEYIPQIDVGIIPNSLSPFTNVNLPVRIFEYLAFKKAVIVPQTRGICEYFDNSSILFFEPDNVDDLARVILRVFQNPTKSKKIIENGYRIYEKYRWGKQGRQFVHTVQNLLNENPDKSIANNLLQSF